MWKRRFKEVKKFCRESFRNADLLENVTKSREENNFKYNSSSSFLCYIKFISFLV